MDTKTQHGLVRRHPIATFLTISFAISYPVLIASLIAGVDLMPAKFVQLLAMLSGAVLVTAWSASRPGAVRRLFSGLAKWRLGWFTYAWLIFAMPALTLLTAIATGTLDRPEKGWGGVAGEFALIFAFSVLTGNLWEETAWAGFLQTRLMSAKGVIAGSLLTAIPFLVMHLPLAFENHGLRGTSLGDAAIDWIAIAVLAPFMRVLIGMLLADFDGSTLAAALVHGSFNAAGAMSVLAGGWQMIPALVILTLLYAMVYARRMTTHQAELVTVA
jgi:membrane protease YdiL (CAAX protease family)